jgi:hypothetical protein
MDKFDWREMLSRRVGIRRALIGNACRCPWWTNEPFYGLAYLNDGWDQEISSIQAIVDTWPFYVKSEYQGLKLTLQASSCAELGKDETKLISSFRCVSSAHTRAE